jgi:predicted DNA-binding transcriptional regulator YafY
MERLVELMLRLQTLQHFTVQELADEFHLSRRTMLRDLQALSMMGVPLAATPGPHGGYFLVQQQRLLPLSLTEDEAIGIVLSYEALLNYADSPFAVQNLMLSMDSGTVLALTRNANNTSHFEQIAFSPCKGEKDWRRRLRCHCENGCRQVILMKIPCLYFI